MEKNRKRIENKSLLSEMRATISFSNELRRDKTKDRLIQYIQLTINDIPNLECDLEDGRVLIKGCLGTDVGQGTDVNGDIVCIKWNNLISCLTERKKNQSYTTVIVEVKKPKNHFITMHCDFKENRVVLLDSFQCTSGLEMYPELESALNLVMKDIKFLIIPVAIQKEIDIGFCHAFLNSLTVEWSKYLTIQQTFEKFLNEINIFQGILKTIMAKKKELKDKDFHVNLKRILKERIKRSVRNHKKLGDITNSLVTEYQNLPPDSVGFIEMQYAKYVADEFLLDLEKLFKTQNPGFFILWSKVQHISEIKDIQKPFDIIKQYKQLQKCATLLDSKAKLRFMKSFHDLCNCNSTPIKELEFVERSFLNELKKQMKDIRFGFTSKETTLLGYLQHASKNEGKTGNLLFEISKDKSLLELSSLANKMLTCTSEPFFEILERLIGNFFEILSIDVITENGKDIIRVNNSFVDLESVNTAMDDQHLIEKCTQIEIQANLYFYVNCNVKWPGKNIILVTNTVIVNERQNQFSIDVSGPDGVLNLEKSAQNGTKSNPDGLAGEPGMHGESGGNVLIIADSFHNAHNMCIISNGGNGSNGQDGGTGADGINGVNGREITEVDFERRFPDVVCMGASDYAGNFRAFKENNTFTTKSEEIAKGEFDIASHRQFSSCSSAPDEFLQGGRYVDGGEYYCKGLTDDNHQVEYGCYGGDVFYDLGAILGICRSRESYCVCYGQQGTPGTRGGDGGKGGAGGPGGFEGKIEIKNWKDKIGTIKTINRSGQRGSDGNDGNGGKGGKNGKNGPDRAHLCPSIWRSTKKYFGYLKIVSYEKSEGDRTYCSKRKKYIGINTKASEYPTLQGCGGKGQNTKRVNNQTMEPSRMKKAPIILKSIKERYQHVFCAKDDSNSKTFKNKFETTYTNYTSKHHRKLIKGAKELELSIQSNPQTPVSIHRKSSHFHFTGLFSFARYSNLETFLTQKLESVFDAVKEGSKQTFPEKDLSTIFAILDQMSIQDSFNDNHYDSFMELIDLLKNKSMRPFCEENWTNLHINYWDKRIMINFKFYLLEKTDRIVNLYMIEKEMDMDTNIPYHKSIIDDLQIRLKILYEHLILDTLKSDDVSHLKAMEHRVKKQLEDLMQEITDYRRTISLFRGHFPRCDDEDDNSKDTIEIDKKIGSEDVIKGLGKQTIQSPGTKNENEDQLESEIEKVKASTFEKEKENQIDSSKEGSALDIEQQKRTDTGNQNKKESYIEKGTVSTIELENKTEKEHEDHLDTDIEIETASLCKTESKTESADKETGMESIKRTEFENKSDNEAQLNYLRLDPEYKSDIIALLNWWSIFSITRQNEICSIIPKLQYLQSDNMAIILKCLKYRLIDQCCQISEEFLLLFLMSLLRNEKCIMNGKYLHIVAATKPDIWIFEWIIQEILCRSDIQDELVCRDLLSKVKVHGHTVYAFICRYMSKLQEGEIITKQTIEVMMGTLQTLNQDVDDDVLLALEDTNIFEWAFTIKWKNNIKALESLPFSWQVGSKLLDAAYYSAQLINRYGQKFIDQIYHCVKTYDVKEKIFLSALKTLHTGKLRINTKDLYMVGSSNDAMRIFGVQSAHQGMSTRENILSIMKADSHTILTEDDVEKIGTILTDINTKRSIPSTLLADTSKENTDINEYSTKYLSSFSETEIKAWSRVCKQTLRSDPHQFSELLTEIVTVIEQGITLKRGFHLRNTQIISVIAFISDKLDESYKGILQQMSTGEGKTIVIVVLSILKVLQGETVDIITSSTVLAKRDSEINKDIFDLFLTSVSNNCSEDKHDRQEAYLSSVVYGDIGTFQRDIMLTEFYDENIIGGRDRKNVVVDEVDSMLLDRGENVLYLSHEIAGINAIEFVYTYIWSLVNSKEIAGNDTDRKKVRQCMLDAMYGVVSMEDIRKCYPPEYAINVNETWKTLQKEKIIDNEGRLLIRRYAHFEKLEDNDSSNACNTSGYLINMLKDTVRKGILIEVPKFLESFIYRHLDTWIRNAFNAKYMEEGKHFVIDINRTENYSGKDANIVIMDIDTGTEQYHMQWNSGLHQFLQLKYNCAISAESLKAVFISNISFFRLYKKLYGLTGTLGSQKERDLLRNMFKVDYITIPTFEESRLVEHDSILCNCTNDWKQSITDKAVFVSKSRPVLVICDTIHSCDEIEKEFKRLRVKVHVYKNSYCELTILENEAELESGCIILATNLAGRGTDIKISKEINDKGGLHVILTYLPSNLRVEEQAFGRAARKGQYGSGQLIICECTERQHPKEMLTISRMKIQRDETENKRISKIEQRYETFIRREEKLFKKFQTFYDNFKHKLISKNTDMEFQKVLLQALLDRWAFWLDSVEPLLERPGNVSCVNEDLCEFLQQVDVSESLHDSNEMTSLLQSPAQLVKAGKAKTSTKDYNEALMFFDNVIDYEPQFSESALYYKVNCLLQKGSCTGDDYINIRNSLGSCKFLIQNRIEKIRNAAQIVNNVSSQYTNKTKTLMMSEGFMKQKENTIQIYNQTIESIDSITGFAVEPFMFVDATCSQLNANMIFSDLDTTKILSPPKVRVFPPEKTAWQYIKESYELYSKDIRSRIKQLMNRDRVSAEDFQNILPSREELWNLLLLQGILVDKCEYILLNDTELQRICDTLPKPVTDILNSFKGNGHGLGDDKKNFIFLFPDQKDKILTKELEIIPIDSFKEKIGFGKMFDVLRKENIVSSCLIALLASGSENQLLDTRLQKFDHINCDSFKEIGLSIKESKAIFEQLVSNKIVSSEGKLLTLELGSICLSSFTKYSSEVRNIIAKYSKYRNCASYLVTEMEFPLDLFSHPHHTLFRDLVEVGIVTPFKVKSNISEKEITKQLKFLYGCECDKKTVESIKNIISIGGLQRGASSRVADPICRYCFEGNILNDDLAIKQFVESFLSELPKMLSSEITDLCRGSSFTRKELETELIEKGICIIDEPNNCLILVIKNTELKDTSMMQNMSYFENEIKCFITSRLQNDLNRSDIEARLDKWREGLSRFDNVATELRGLADKFTEEQLLDLCDEILSATNNGFGDLIVLTERKWSFKSVCKMFCVLAIGMIQIGIAIAIEFYSVGTGTFFANAFLSEGIGDIVFAVECMISGHCTMQSYLQHKTLSLAMTTIGVGIGAYAARGAKFSKFGYRIGGQFLNKQSGITLLQGGVSKRLLAKAAAKRIGNKMIEVTSMRFVDAGVDFVIEKSMRKSMLTLWGTITENSFNVEQSTIESLIEPVSTLARKVGKQNAEQIIEKYINKCFIFRESDVSKILCQFANAFGNGLNESLKKLEFSGDSNVEWLSKLINIVSYVEKGIHIVDVVHEIGTLRSFMLENFKSKIIHKLQFEDGHEEDDDCGSWASNKIDIVIKKANTAVTKYIEMQFENTVVKPMLQKVGNKASKQMSKGVRKMYRYGGKCLHQSAFRKLKTKFELEFQHELSETKDEIKLQYNKNLLDLLKKIRSPILFADIVEEGIPLGIHSIQAVSEITGTVIEIEIIGGEGLAMPPKFTPDGMNSEEQKSIFLQFHVNHKTRIGHFVSPNSKDCKSKKYDCLLTAVLQETGILLDRSSIAHTIKTNDKIRERIEKGFHEHFIIEGGTGGVKSNREHLPTFEDVKDPYYKIKKLKLQLESLESEKNKNKIADLNSELKLLKGKKNVKEKRKKLNFELKQAYDAENKIQLTLSEIKENYDFFSKSNRDIAKKTHNSIKGTGNDEFFQVSWLMNTIIPSCEPGNKQFIKPTKIKIGGKVETVDFLKAFFIFRVDTRFVIFEHLEDLHGHAGALYEKKNKKIKKDGQTKKQPNAGALMKGQSKFHEKRGELILKNFDNHLFGILAAFQGHLDQIPTKKDLLEKINLKNRYSATGLDLGKTADRDKFIMGYEREKFKILASAEHLINSNKDMFKAGPQMDKLRFTQFKKFFNDKKKTIDVGDNFKQEIQKQMENVDSFKSLGDILQDPAKCSP